MKLSPILFIGTYFSFSPVQYRHFFLLIVLLKTFPEYIHYQKINKIYLSPEELSLCKFCRTFRERIAHFGNHVIMLVPRCKRKKTVRITLNSISVIKCLITLDIKCLHALSLSFSSSRQNHYRSEGRMLRSDRL